MAEKLNEGQIKELKEAFSLFDKDSDGFITIKECSTVMRALGQCPTEREIQNMVRDVNVGESELIDFSDFIIMMSWQMKNNDKESEIIDAFRVLDKEGTGFISVSELKHVLTTVGEKLTDEEAEDMVGYLNVNSDGYVEYEEFVNTFMSK